MPVSSQPNASAYTVRMRVEHASDPVVRCLGDMPKAVPTTVILVLVAFGAIFRGLVGAVCFGSCALVVAWLLYLDWPRIAPLERMMRGAVLILATALTIVCTAG